jgi:hypothetical protein
MTHRHRLDPIHLHHAAERLGDIVAKGEMADADASATIVSWVEKVDGVDRPGLRARLHWTMRDRAIAAQRQRENVVTAIRWAVRDLIRAGAPQAAIEEAAGKANADYLEWDEIVPILRNEWDTVHGRRRRG